MARAFIATSLVLLGGCMETCRNTSVATLDAPDGRHQAELFQRACGATTGASTQVSVSAKSEQAEAGAGNTFVADDDHGTAFEGGWGGPWANVKWVSPNALLIQFDAKSRVFKQVADVKGVRVVYHSVPH